jgi:hypothetical protein
MKNSECTIYIMSKNRWIQKFRKEKNGWVQTSSRGIERICSAEQLLSHLLPILAGKGQGRFTVRVEPDEEIKLNPQLCVQRWRMESGGVELYHKWSLYLHCVEAPVKRLKRRVGEIMDKQLGLSEKSRTLTKSFTFSMV